MFKENKYTRWYFSIIERAELRNNSIGYCERHHIIPRTLGGDNSKRNIVTLTAREHYICHALLPRMCIGGKHKSSMVFAFLMMGQWESNTSKGQRYKSKVYAITKARYVESIRGTNHPLTGTSWSDERRAEHSRRLKELGINKGLTRSPELRAKISATKIARGASVGEKNPMYGKNHTKETRQLQSEKKKAIMTDDRLEMMVTANPRSRRVRTQDGLEFDSLSAARRHYGLQSKHSAIIRINRGDWVYV